MSDDAHLQLVTDLNAVSSADHETALEAAMEAATEATHEEFEFCSDGDAGTPAPRKDYFIERDGKVFAGTHLIIDIVDGERLNDLEYIEQTLTDCVEAAGATLLHLHLHHFTPNDGVSGVAVLAESHISIHTWPECGYAALDVFMCGGAQPHAAIDVLRDAFKPRDIKVRELLRGEDL